MNTELSNREPAEKSGLSIDEVAELCGVNPWTVRLWVDRFGMQGCTIDADGNLLFPPCAVERIGVICRLTKKKMSLDEVRKYLELHTV